MFCYKDSVALSTTVISTTYFTPHLLHSHSPSFTLTAFFFHSHFTLLSISLHSSFTLTSLSFQSHSILLSLSNSTLISLAQLFHSHSILLSLTLHSSVTLTPFFVHYLTPHFLFSIAFSQLLFHTHSTLL